jgi:hemolysin activation/secretion protein
MIPCPIKFHARRPLLWAIGCVLAAALTLPALAAPLPLRSIVVLNQPSEAQRAGWMHAAPGIDAARISRLNTPAGRALLVKFLGHTIDRALLHSIRNALEAYYKSIHYPFVSVDIPAQDATNGTLQVVVIEARLGKVSVAGNKWFGTGQYIDALHVHPGMTIDEQQLNDDINWLNRNQYREATIVAPRGPTIGTTNLIVRTTEKFPFTVTGGVSNTGTQATSLYRLNTGFDWGNAFWRGDDLNFNFSMSPDAYLLRQYSLSYTSYLPWHDIFSIQGSLFTSHPPSGSLFGSTGLTGIVSLRYTHMLPGLGSYTHDVILGYDFKSTNNNLLFGGFSVFNTTSEIDQFTLGYGGQIPDRFGSTSFELDLVGSPGNLTPDNTNAAFNAQQGGATANYAYAHLIAERLTNLPRGFTWDLRGTAQLSDATLLPSEQVIFGGYASVRGFEEQGATRDNGVLVENELRLPPIHTGLPAMLGAKGVTDQLVPFLFLDFGAGWNHQEFDGEASWIELSSVGPGVRWQISRYLTSRFVWGIPLQRYGQAGPLLGPQFAVQATF